MKVKIIKMHPSVGAKTHVVCKLITAAVVLFMTIGNVWAESRAIQYNYNQTGQVVAIDGPRADVSDVNSYTYNDSTGDRLSSTNALGHVTLYEDYGRRGEPGKIISPNGLITLLEYNWRGQITRQTLRLEDNDLVTTYHYDPVGQLEEIRPPDGRALFYDFDAAHRLVGISNSLGERIDYKLDAMGNVRATKTYGNNGQLVRQHRQVFDGLSRLREKVGGSDSQTVRYGYDANGNRSETVDPKQNPATRRQFDALDRLAEMTDRAGGVTRFSYNDQDQITAVTDPEGITTTYEYNGFGELIAEHSPDRGATTYSYDAAGNLIRREDANGVVALYDYDALNRLVTVHYPESPEQDVTYLYDSTEEGNKGVGHLTGMIFAGGDRYYRYDVMGRVVRDTQIIDGHAYAVGYHYNDNNQLARKTLPSGIEVHYAYNEHGQRGRVSVQTASDGALKPVVNTLDFLPFGPLLSFRYGNGIAHQNRYDLDYRLVGQHSAVWDVEYDYDLNSNVARIRGGVDSLDETELGYNFLDRLIRADGSYGHWLYDYDGVGNRQSDGIDGSSNSYTYAAGSHHLLQREEQEFDYDAGGNLLDNSQLAFLYNADGHMDEVRSADSGDVIAKYYYNPLRQRIRKNVLSVGPDYAQLAKEQRILANHVAQQIEEKNAQLEGYLGALLLANERAESAAAKARESEMQADVWRQDIAVLREETAEKQSRADAMQQQAEQTRQGIVTPAESFLDGLNNWLVEVLAASLERFGEYLQAQADGLAAELDILLDRLAQKEADAKMLAQTVAEWEAESRRNADNTESVKQELALLNEQADTARALEREYTDKIGGEVEVRRTHYVYGPDGKLLGEYDNDGQPHREYLYLEGQPVALLQHTLSQDVPVKIYFYHNDHLGTPKVLTDEDQAVVWQANHAPFGKAQIETELVTNNLRFPGQYYDEETGLHYNWHRYYDPGTGRYVTSDPIGLDGGVNTYGYAYQNPITNFDPDGKLVWFGIPAAYWLTGGAALSGGAVCSVNNCGQAAFDSVSAAMSGYSDDGHLDENDLLDNPPLPSGFFDPNKNNCDENRRNLKILRKRLERQMQNRVNGFATKGRANQYSAHTHQARINRLEAKIREYERAVANCPPDPEECD